MFSRILILCTTLSLIVGCDSKVGDKPPETPVQEFSGTQCLSDLNPVLEAYFQGEAKPADITKSWDCVISAAEKFKRYVRGKSEQEYTSQEIATFLEKNFLDPKDGTKISPALQLQFMRLKQLVIGGRLDAIDRNEIDEITNFIQELKKITLDLAPHMKILSMNWAVSQAADLEADIRKFESANETLQVSARQLATVIEKNGLSYQLSDLTSLMTELQNFLGESWEFPATLQRYMPVVKKVKAALAGGNENIISAKEWRRFSVLGSRGYVQYLRYYYFIQTVPETGGGYRLSYLARTIEDMLSVFEELVAGKPEGQVTRQEVYELMKTIELVNPDFKISEKLIVEVMKVKQLFFGGKIDSFASSDFENARLKVNQVKVLIERFMPYYLIYGGEWDPTFYEQDEADRIFAESQAVLESSASEAGALFEGSYDLDDLASLVEELENVYGINFEESTAGQLRAYLPLVIEIKKMVLGGRDAVIKKADWEIALKYSAKTYSTYLYYSYFLKNEDLHKLSVLDGWGTLVNQGLNLVQDLTKLKEDSKFSHKELMKVGEHLVRLDLLPKTIKTKSLSLVLEIVLNRVLVEPKRRIQGREPWALSASSIEVLRSEFNIWHASEMWLKKLGREADSEGGFYPKELYRRIREAKKDRSTDERKARSEALAELEAMIASTYPMTFDSENRVLITNGSTPRYKSNSLILLNLQRTISRTLMRAFLGSTRRIDNLSGATLKELESAFRTLRPIMVDLDLIDSSTSNFATLRFQEANMFTPHGNGDSYMSFAEMTDMVGLIWSGLTIHNKVRRDLVRTCLGGRWNGSSKTQMSLSCAMSVYHAKAKSHLSSMPVFGGYTDIAPQAVWNDYMINVFKASGYRPNSQSVISVGDVSLVPHVLQYVELIYAKFDADKNGQLNRDESLSAYPSFKGILLELAKEQLRDGSLKEEDLVSLFTYILRYGRPPETVPEKLGFVMNWKGKPSKWDLKADRNQLARILGYIADKVAQ